MAENENSMGDAVTLRPGDERSLGRIDQYTLVRELGGGGFGTVYLAKDMVSGVEYAVKGLPPMVRNSGEEMENVRANFALVSRLSHTHIARAHVLHLAREVVYYDPSVRAKLRVDPGDTLMVMEYAPGVTLSKWRKQFPDGKVPLAQALEIVRQMAAALDYAHGERILHRDVKPANVMVETKPNGALVARVLDFGLAAEIRSSMGRVSREIHDTSGTRPYMAPEQWVGAKQGPATDQYALAVLFHELVTGAVPFASLFDTGDPVLMMTVVTTRAPEIPADLPEPVRLALARALAKKPEERFPGCGEFVAALEGMGNFSRKERKDRKETGGSRFRATVGILAAAALALAALGGWWLFGGKTLTRPGGASSSSSNREDRDETRPSRESTNSARDGHSRSQPKIQQATAEAQQLTDAILAYENFGRPGTPSPLGSKVTGEEWQEATEDKLNFVLGKERMPNGQDGTLPVLYNGTVRDGKIRDPWGRAYRYRIMSSAGNANVSGHAKDYVVGVWSLGPDGEPNTDDDICTWPDSKRSATRGSESSSSSDRDSGRRENGGASVRSESGGRCKTFTLPGGATMEMIYVAPGTFTMGSPSTEDGRDGDEIQHRVRLTKGFWLGKYEVTQAQWKSVMGENPSCFQGDNRPVENVSWEDCQRFIRKINSAQNCVVRLPTEAEWEFACRAGSSGRFGGNGNLDDMGWDGGNSASGTHPVGQKLANAWGFYDMHGNVWEWCSDWYGDYGGDATDPIGPASGVVRVLRGGGWFGDARDCRSARRGWDLPVYRAFNLGLRLCCSAGLRE